MVVQSWYLGLCRPTSGGRVSVSGSFVDETVVTSQRAAVAEIMVKDGD